MDDCPSDDAYTMVETRLKRLVAGAKIGSDAIAKSLRCYETKVHPLFFERLSVWWDELDKRSTFEGKTFTYNKNCSGMNGSNVMNYVFQSFYEQEAQDEVEIIYPRLSRKTSVWISSSEGLDMHSEVSSWLKRSNDGDPYTVIELRALAEQELGSTVVRDLLDNPKNSTLSQGISLFLHENHFTFPSHKFLKVHGRPVSQDLLMKVKYYPNRDDNRAYCSDHNRLRSLVASILNRMISPKSMTTRLRLHSASILRPDKKDILDIRLKTADSDEYGSYLLLSDVSNFTGSFANAWLMIYIMGLEAACGKLGVRHQIASVDGQLIGTSWHELLLLYVYLTAGVPCWIEDHDKFGYLSGGFLGVGGNITIGLLCLAVILQDVLCRLRAVTYDVHIQAGGDDVAIAYTCKRSESERVAGLVKREIEQYVGRVKEFEIIDLEDQEDGILEGVVFCKKRITVEKDHRVIHLQGEPSVPLPESLIPIDRINGARFQIQAWRELDYSLRMYESLKPGQESVTDSLRQLFLDTYRIVRPVRTYKVNYLTGSFRLLMVGSYRITDVAHKVACDVRTAQYNGIYTLVDLESKIRYALIAELVTMMKVQMSEDDSELIVMAQSEVHLMERMTFGERIHVGFDPIFLNRLISIVNQD